MLFLLLLSIIQNYVISTSLSYHDKLFKYSITKIDCSDKEKHNCTCPHNCTSTYYDGKNICVNNTISKPSIAVSYHEKCSFSDLNSVNCNYYVHGTMCP